GWKADARYDMQYNIIQYDIPECVSLNWDNLSNGSTNSINVSVDSTSTDEQTNTYEINVEAGLEYKVPKVFQIGGSVSSGYEGTYSSETKVHTEFEQEITASLENLHSQVDGLNISHLHMKGYWFRPDINPDWWFYDSLWGYKPWYLAWIVNSSSEKLQLLSPGNGNVLEDTELLFNWQPEEGELSDYTFYILNSPSIHKNNILIKESVGNLTQFSPLGFKPEKGNTYYWAVRGIGADGTPIWSPRFTFTMKQELTVAQSSTLQALVYPNPAPKGDINIIIDSQESGGIEVSLFEINGRLIGTEQFHTLDTAPITVTLSGYDLLPGIYFAVIQSENEQIVKKVMIR
ncbi:MAG: T9SS type A sorting domain-containing protein, partial [Candidatus Electryoneaceae bacterium]|nr:T9SS type A sorting domain-containing protein [Candidatus Electryoneaceae bacterium]